LANKKAVRKTEVESCYQTCRLTIVESVPQNLTITKYPVLSTFEAWQYLITTARTSIDVAAYKSSLRGKHTLGSIEQDYSLQVRRVLFSQTIVHRLVMNKRLSTKD
jgi:hypothetical protein